MFFLHQIKRTNNTVEKGIVVKNDFDAAKQSYHAYLGAYAYNHDPATDYVSVMITDMTGGIRLNEVWPNPDEVVIE